MLSTLIVDGHAAFRSTLRQVLTTRFPFLHVTEATSISEALERTQVLRPNIFFVDVRLPDGSGLDLVRLLARGHRSAAIGIVTSFDILEYRWAAAEAGASHFIAKGDVCPAAIIAVVNWFLERRGPVRQP